MDRRVFLGAVAGVSTLAGCTGRDEGDETTRQDGDGDGVADSEDYAPNDPDVQSKSDLGTVATTTATTATTATTTPSEPTETTTQTTTETTTESVEANVLTAGEGWSEQESHVTGYSSRSVTANVAPDGPTVAGTFDGQSAKLLAFAYEFPRGDSITYGTSDPVTIEETTTLTASLDLTGADVDPDTPVHYMAFLAPGDLEVEEMSAEDLVFFHETDAFVLRDDEVTIERYTDSKALSDESDEGYERNAVEGAYNLSFEGSTNGKSWATNFYIYKSSYLQAVEKPRGRSRPEYVAYARQEGFADELAGILADEAEENGFTGKREQVEFVIDFVQNLPYVPDDVSKGYDDYTKFITETITEAGGDCEDTAIMLAAILQAEPFGYDMILIQPPGHMAAGIYGSDDLEGYYWTYDDRKYYYIETTGSGWGIGDVPETYQDEEARVYQV